MKKNDPRKFVREGYAKVAVTSSSCCGSSSARKISKGIGYSEREMASVPAGANLGLGCGNPVALASLKPGETVLDLGAGAGLDCFLAAKKVGRKGKVIGVDMTPEMLEKARGNAVKARRKNVEFRLGEIENIPAADCSVDAVISNCVINLSPDKKRVFREAYRVLRRGGRLMVSDIVLLKPLPAFIRKSVAAYVGCVAGSLLKKEYLAAIRSAGFKNVRVLDETVFPFDYIAGDPNLKVVIEKSRAARKEMYATARSVVSIKVSAKKC